MFLNTHMASHSNGKQIKHSKWTKHQQPKRKEKDPSTSLQQTKIFALVAAEIFLNRSLSGDLIDMTMVKDPRTEGIKPYSPEISHINHNHEYTKQKTGNSYTNLSNLEAKNGNLPRTKDRVTLPLFSQRFWT